MIRPSQVIALDEVADDLNIYYYEIGETTVRVIAVLPMRRDPAWIRGKLQGRTDAE